MLNHCSINTMYSTNTIATNNHMVTDNIKFPLPYYINKDDHILPNINQQCYNVAEWECNVKDEITDVDNISQFFWTYPHMVTLCLIIYKQLI